MNKRILAIIAVVLALAAVIGLTIPRQSDSGQTYNRQKVLKMAEQIDFSAYNPDSIIAPDENTGHLADKILGSADAPVLIFEYADYACSHCAEQNSVIAQIVEDYDGQVAVVFRDYLLNFPNSLPAAKAATAAANQGYWETYKNLLFGNQVDWFYLTGDSLQSCLEDYFKQASNGAGDLDKFREDMESTAVAQRLAFNYAAGEAVGLTGTPLFRINGAQVSASKLRDTIDELLSAP